MLQAKRAHTIVDAEVTAPMINVQLARYNVQEPVECDVTQKAGFRLIYFSQRPPNATARASYWKANRYERLGDLFLLPEGEKLLARGDAGQGSAVCVSLASDFFRQWSSDNYTAPDAEHASCLDIRSNGLRHLMLRLADEARCPGFASEAILEALSIQTSVELARHFRAQEKGAVRGKLAPWRLRTIDERLAEVARPPTLTELAALCNISSRHLARSFRASVGTSIGEYIARKQVERARALLRTTKSLKAIVHELGFKSTSGFCFSFRNATGQSPGRFRAEVRAAQKTSASRLA